jgi:4-diphosphocytidyl-2-C-methyl-D-erythritol kinase
VTRLAISVPAKINLHLQVLGVRRDGFHELRTLFQSIDLADELHASPAADEVLELRVEPEGAVTGDEDNMVLRAAAALREHSGVAAGASLDLYKRIPVAGGLGGGSADAAAALILLDRLWNLDLGTADLVDLAADLGADVPFFLHGGLAVGVGRGEEVYPLSDLRSFDVVVVTPRLQVPTAEVFDSFAPRLTSSGLDATVYAFTTGRPGDHRIDPPWEDLFNELESLVVERWPEVGRVVDALRATEPLHAAVTGSGASVFAVYPDSLRASDAAAALGDRWQVFVGSTLTRDRARPVVRDAGSPKEERGWK